MNLFPIFQSDDEQPIQTDNVGTVESPLEVPGNVHVPTGVNATRQTSDRWRRFIAGDKKDKDVFFPANTRQGRRAAERSQRTTQRKHQLGYFRRELAKENAARDLLNLFLLADGVEPASPVMRNRANVALAARVAYLHDEQQKAYDKAIAARQKDRSLPAPTPPTRHEEIRAQLWELAKTATLPSPKAPRFVIEDVLAASPRDLRAVTTSRTGRAG